ncbi:MAG: hypothetical protein JNN06_06850 [Gemmobacter sp.]|uniref:hypothetical protein n=1 Tax=Gemmobacter sp. TaxID=1898957 RepID=UPI001A5C1BA3|nr:hypothetical protein [Gemmobacter sp.]MBL8561982.1 hypothetical protein [Gemmobacter sp.]
MRYTAVSMLFLAPLALVACGPTVPESGAGVGFGDYDQYNAQREAALTTGAPVVAQGAQPIMGGGVSGGAIGAAPLGSAPAAAAPATGFSTDRIGAAINAASGGASPAAIPPAAGAPLSALPATPAMPAAAPVAAAPATPAPGPAVPVNQLPTRAGEGPNLVQYALSTTNPLGQQVYDRSSLQLRDPAKVCQSYGSADKAQAAFLDAGGPEKDRKGLDPDGDGFACGWDPTPFRNAVR